MARLIDKINSPKDLKQHRVEDLPRIAQELREEIIHTVSKTGGHLGASLGHPLLRKVHFGDRTGPVLGLFVHLAHLHQRRGLVLGRRGVGGVDRAVCLQRLKLLEGPVEGALEASVEPGVHVELLIETRMGRP